MEHSKLANFFCCSEPIIELWYVQCEQQVAKNLDHQASLCPAGRLGRVKLILNGVFWSDSVTAVVQQHLPDDVDCTAKTLN